MCNQEQFIVEWLEDHRADMVRDLKSLVDIPSVSDAESDVKPFGPSCRDALAHMLSLGAKRGYTVRDYEGYVERIQFSEGGRSVGIWSHLDVVPVPDEADWRWPPFDATLVEDRYLIGRGVQHNKAPAIGVLYAMDAVAATGHRFRHGYSLYLGTNEECGMADLDYFVKHYPCPDYPEEIVIPKIECELSK